MKEIIEAIARGMGLETLETRKSDGADSLLQHQPLRSIEMANKIDYTCADCKGTGADPKKTANALRRGHIYRGSYIQCWTCNGNGLDPAKFFRWSTPTSPALAARA